MKDVEDKSCRQTRNTHCMLNKFFFLNRAVYEIMWKDTVERGRPQMTTWFMHIACWLPKTTNTRTQVV
jgi:hypothetical protein